MFANARLTSVPGFFLRISKDIMLTRSQLASIKSNLVVKQDKIEKVFYSDIGEHRAVIEYEEEGNVLKLVHTEIPKELEGRGVGKQLAKATFDQLTGQGKKIEVHCEFLQHFVERYGKEYKKHIVN